MPKPTKNAPLICTILSIVAVVGIVVGLLTKIPLIPIFLLLPAVIYEVYRTEGDSTRLSSVLLLLVLIGEIILIIFNINWNLATFLGEETKTVASFTIALGDIKVVAPLLMAVLSVVLFIRTYGIYTKWLSVVIFVTAFAVVYIIDPEIFKIAAKFAVDEGFSRL